MKKCLARWLELPCLKGFTCGDGSYEVEMLHLSLKVCGSGGFFVQKGCHTCLVFLRRRTCMGTSFFKVEGVVQ